MLNLNRPLMWAITLTLSVSAALAQTQGRLVGTVTDASGAIVVNARLIATNSASGVTYTTTSNETGTYTFPSLIPGAYELACESTGFKRFVRGGIVLETGISRTVDVGLEVGATTETVNVQASAPILDSETSDLGQVIERNSVQKLPLESRRAASLVRLVGFVSYSGEVGSEQLPFFSLAGGRAREQNWTIDGLNNQNNAGDIGQLAMNPPSESLQEFKVEVNNYSAELGRSGGGFILMTTRSGGNQFHGALYEFFRNDKLDARTFFAPSKAPLRYNIFGGSVGGPIVRNKTFFFFNYEGARRRIGQTFSNDTVPHPADRTGDFSRRTDVRILDPLTGQPFPGNIIPANRIDPVARQLVNFWPLPNRPGNDVTRAPVNNHIINASDKLDQDYYVARIDHAQGANDRFFFRYLRNTNPNTTPIAFQGSTTPADPRAFKIDSTYNNYGGSWIHNFTPSLINEFRYLYLNGPARLAHVGVGSGVAGQVGLKGVDPANFPFVTVAGLTALGNFRNTRDVGRKTQEVVNNLTWVRGSHQVKAGFNYRYSWFQNLDKRPVSGQFNFGNRATADGLAAFLLGWTTSGVLETTDVVTKNNYWAGFVADDWKFSPKLTLNLGLRWEVDAPPTRDDDKYSGFDPRAINPVSGTPGIVTFAPFAETGRSPYRFEKNNFGPRLGFAYQPRDGWVIRGGYGLFYNKPWRHSAAEADIGVSDRANFNSIDGGFTPPFLLRDGMPPVPSRATLGPGFGAVPVGSTPQLSPTFFQTDHVTGYNQQWNLSVQKLLKGNIVAEVAYLANVGHKLFGPNINLNMTPLVNGRGPDRQDQTRRPFPQYSGVILLSPPWGNSNYQAMNLKFEKRYASGLGFLMNYTWSKFLDDITGTSELGVGVLGYTHIERRRFDKALSGNHIGHRYIGSAVYDLPVGRKRKFDIANPVLNQIIGGWTFAPIIELRSGPPFGVAELTNVTNTFSDAQRPNLLRDPTLGGDRPRSAQLLQWFDTAAFAAPGVGVFGDSPRTICCAPGFVGVDVSVQKNFPIRENWNLQFRTDFYNVLNRPNFGSPGPLRGRADFGRISTTVGTGRQGQFSLRLEF